MDDRKPIIVYAIITEMNSNFHLVIITKKEPEPFSHNYQKGTRKMTNNHLFRLCSVLMISLFMAGCINADPPMESLEITSAEDGAEKFQPVIDGVLQPGEWDQADLFHFEDESELFLLQKGGYLYLAIRAGIDEMIAGNVFLQNGNQIFIMHASAALGTVIYQEAGDSWVKIQDFEWCCRSKIESEAAREDREIIFNQDGWLGINSFNGNENELEYKIRLTGTETYLAVNFLSADTPGLKLVWPIGLVDGPAQPVDGGFPKLMDFSPENWLNLEELP